jgi:hypothetical protein
MIDLKLDGESDLKFNENDLQLVSGVDEVIQSVQTLLKTRLGEFFGDTDMGLDQSDILGKNFNEQYAMSDITETLQQDSRVTAVTEISFEKEDRNLICYVTFEIDETIESKLEVVLDA